MFHTQAAVNKVLEYGKSYVHDPLHKKRPEAIFWITSLDWHCFQNNTKGDVDVETKYDGSRQLLKSQNPDRQKIQVNLAKWARMVLFAIVHTIVSEYFFLSDFMWNQFLRIKSC